MGLASERRGRRPRRAGDSAPLAQLPWKQPRRGFPPVRLLSDDQIETIHRAALDLLEDIGMDILLPEAREILADAGAIVAGERVRIGRDIIEAAIGTAARRVHLSCPQSEPFDPASAATGSPSRRSAGRPTARTPITAGGPARFADNCQLHQARPVLQLHPHRRRRLDRCARCPCLGAPSPHHAQQGACSPTRCCSPPRPAAPACSTASRSPGIARGVARRAGSSTSRRVYHRHQHQLAAEARRPDGDGHHRDGAPRPDLPASRPFTLAGRHGAGHRWPARLSSRMPRRWPALPYRSWHDPAPRSSMAASPPMST